MMDFRINTFLAVCSCMSFTKAAELLNKLRMGEIDFAFIWNKGSIFADNYREVFEILKNENLWLIGMIVSMAHLEMFTRN